MDDFKTFDIETTSTEPWRQGAEIVSMQLNDGDNLTFVDIKDRDWTTKTGKILQYLADPDVKIIIHNALFEDYWIYEKYGFHIENFEDTMILPFVLDKGAPFEYLQGGGSTSTMVNNRRKLGAVGLKNVGPYYTGIGMGASDVIKALGKQGDVGIVRCIRALYTDLETPIEEIFKGKKKVLDENNITDRDSLYEFFSTYSLDDVIVPHEMWKKLRDWTQPECYKIEIGIIPHLVELMSTGMRIDTARLDEMDLELIESMKQSTENMIKLTGNPEFQPSRKAMYADALEARGHVLPKTVKGNRGTGKKYLMNIEDELVDYMNQYNKAKARKSQNIDGIRGQTDSKGVYHPSYISCGTVHGRMASRTSEIS